MRVSGRTAAEIAASLEGAIRDRRFAPGDTLPTVRQLAKSLKLSPATVAAAYRLLHGRALVTGERRRGTRVRVQAETLSHARSGPSSIAGTVDLFSGNPDPVLLPPLDSAFRAVSLTPTLYGGPADVRELVAFAKGEFAADGIDVPGVLVTAGGLDGIERVLREHLRPGDRVAVEDPVFPALLNLLAAGGFAAEPLATDAEGPTPRGMDAALRRRPAALIVTPRAQNPTGASLSTQRIAELRAILKRHPVPILIENDPFGPVSGAPAATLTEGRSRWAIVRSMTKCLGPDLRLAIVAGDELTLARVRARQAVGMRWVSHVLQQIALALWSDPSAGRHLVRVAETYAHRRRALIGALSSVGVQIPAASGFNVWIPVRHETHVVEQLAQLGWGVAAGERFRLASGPGIRVTTSALAPDAAQRFASDLASVFRSEAPALA